MGCNNSKQHGEKGNNKRRNNIKKILRFQSRRSTNPSRPLSYAGVVDIQQHDTQEISTRPLSMFDAVTFHDIEISMII